MEEDRPLPSSAAAQPDMFDSAAESDAAAETGADPRERRRAMSQSRSVRAMERLRDRVMLAARELTRLREENASLHRELESLKSSGLGSFEGTPVVFSDTPAALRARVESFIDSIDAFLDSAGQEESAEQEL
jgi:predicted RNase H-like nuclease (RuvC/YqgF family)